MISSLIPALSKALGPFYEIVVHDFSQLEHSIIALGGNITGRKIGDPATNVVLSAIKSGCKKDILGYKNVLSDGRVLKSSTIFIRNDSGEAIGCLCMNFILDSLLAAEKSIQSLLNIEPKHSNSEEDFTSDINQLASVMLNKAINSVHKPITYMSKEDKLNIIQNLDEQGLFLIKGAIDATAAALALSRATIYNYIEEIRGRRLADRINTSTQH
jgi:predicted transcriptional regulator YheO